MWQDNYSHPPHPRSQSEYHSGMKVGYIFQSIYGHKTKQMWIRRSQGKNFQRTYILPFVCQTRHHEQENTEKYLIQLGLLENGLHLCDRYIILNVLDCLELGDLYLAAFEGPRASSTASASSVDWTDSAASEATPPAIWFQRSDLVSKEAIWLFIYRFWSEPSFMPVTNYLFQHKGIRALF